MPKVDLRKYWWVLVLVAILLFSYYIRVLNIVPDRILSFDPTFQYRFTKYFTDYGHLPAWDEISYYTGRIVDITADPPLMFYITGVVFWLVGSFGMSLLTVSAYMSAIYGALIVIPAFLLGNELTNKYGGFLSALLIGTAPQILTRTFGSSYDTDQIVLFFLLLTLYLGFRAFRKKDVPSYALAIAGFSGFMLAWGFSMYSFFILVGFAFIFFVTSAISHYLKERKDIAGSIKAGIAESKSNAIFLAVLTAGLTIFAAINKESILTHMSNVVSFAGSAERWIVNISIAELQPFSIFNVEGWLIAMGRFVTGISVIDVFMLIAFLVLIAMGFLLSYKKRDIFKLSILITLLIVGIYTTFRGIRFTEFTSALFIILIGAGFGSVVSLFDNDKMKKMMLIGLAVFIGFIAMTSGAALGSQLGPDINANWDNAWNFLKTQTPTDSIVGTWWDPGHMINAIAERRNFADGGHCHNECLFNINDRITDLGKIMATTDENESLELIQKYEGDSSAVYWIASDDLIGKYRWLQYFGTGCDGTGILTENGQSTCPLYIQLAVSSQTADSDGSILFLNYQIDDNSRISLYNGQFPIPMLVQGIDIALFDEFIVYNGTQPMSIKFSQEELNSFITALKPLESQLGARFTNRTIPYTVWIPQHYQYIVLIPPNLRNTVFTRMFMLEGQGLDHFEQVFRNEQVKIYKVV